MIVRDAYDNSELENTNLRTLLRWCLPQLSERARAELGQKLSAPLNSGGIVPDYLEDLEQEYARVVGLLDRLVAHLEKIAPPDGTAAPPPDDAWFRDLEPLLNAARAYEEPRQAPTLASLRGYAEG